MGDQAWADLSGDIRRRRTLDTSATAVRLGGGAKEKQRMAHHLTELGNRLSCKVANAAGHPLAQIGIVIVCALVIAIGGSAAENALTLILSVAAITLTQMVLNQQKRHDAALHLKIDELIYAKTGARDELAGIEGASEDELEALRRTGDAAEDVLEARHATRAETPPASRPYPPVATCSEH